MSESKEDVIRMCNSGLMSYDDYREYVHYIGLLTYEDEDREAERLKFEQAIETLLGCGFCNHRGVEHRHRATRDCVRAWIKAIPTLAGRDE